MEKSGRLPRATALTVPRLTPSRAAIFRCENRPSWSSRRISSITGVAIIVQLSPKVTRFRFRFRGFVVGLEGVPEVVGGQAAGVHRGDLHNGLNVSNISAVCQNGPFSGRRAGGR